MNTTIPAQTDDLKRALRHILWVGGAPDSGKTSIATLLAQGYGLQEYHFDRHEMDHFARLDPFRNPALYAANPERMAPEQRWLGSTPAEMAQATIASWTERAAMAIADLLAMPATSMILAEGPGFFPEYIAPLLSSPHQAVWLVPTESFKRATAARRGKPGNRDQTSDPARATRNLIERDLLMGRHIQQHARELGLALYEVNGSASLNAVVALVESHFAPLLPRAVAPSPPAPPPWRGRGERSYERSDVQ